MLCSKCGTTLDERGGQCSNCGTELTPAQLEELAGRESLRFESLGQVKSRFGRKAQVGGGITFFVGILLRLTERPGSGVDVVHKMPILLIVIGVFLLLMGTLWRWFYLG
jgi:hypothetical protein